MLKAPYNFAPLPIKVVYPDWANLVTLDVPFEDATSGVIELNLEAKTAIFVRNGHKLDDTKEERFSQVDGQYFIPGSTVKGCLRNVVEILGFGKIKQYNDVSFSVRDLNNRSYQQMLRTPAVRAGWLCRVKGSYYLFDAGEITNRDEDRILAQDIDDCFEVDKQDGFQTFITGKVSNDDKNAAYKYKKLACILKKYSNRPDDECRRIANGEEFCDIDDKYLVFTGQPGSRNEEKRKGKHKEFLFTKYPERFVESDWEKVSDKDIQVFKSIHATSADYTEFWKSKLERGYKIPVFFQKKNGVHYMGLSYMFKYPAKENVESAIQNTYPDNIRKPDLADLLFGYIDDDKSLKGRVSVGNAFSVGKCQEDDKRVTLMATPHPSYYPLYLKSNKSAISWNDTYGEKIQIAGYKRYPVRNVVYEFPRWKKDSRLGNMDSVMTPLKAGCQFTCFIRYHNLRAVELGALLYAISLGNQQKRFHNMGACKPYGYGKVSTAYKLLCVDENGDLKEATDKAESAIQVFVNYMEKQTGNWANSPTVTELLRMAEGIPTGRESEFEYMQMENMQSGRRVNEFVEGKKSYREGERFRSFSEILRKKQ